MRLFHIADYGGPYSGSFIPMLRAAIQAATAEGWECHAVFSEGARGREWMPSFRASGVRCHFIPARPRARARAALDELIGSSRVPTILHTHFSAFDLPAAALAGERRETYVFWHVHSPFQSRPIAVLRNLVRFALLGRQVSATLCVAPDVAHQARRRLGRRVMFLPNAIDVSRFDLAAPECRHAARAGLGLPDDAAVILHFGWDWERKGGPEYLLAVRELLSGGASIVPLTVGGDEPARRRAEELGIAEAVRVLDPTEDVRGLYAAADVFVTPARAEGMPFALAEALCCGLAAVASPLAGHRFIAAEIEACHVCEAEPQAIAREVMALLAREPAVAGAEARAANQWISAHMGLEAWAQRLLSAYRRAIPALAVDTADGGVRVS
jgi:glycosyltransferase involved in cell wall biosynthesis